MGRGKLGARGRLEQLGHEHVVDAAFERQPAAEPDLREVLAHDIAVAVDEPADIAASSQPESRCPELPPGRSRGGIRPCTGRYRVPFPPNPPIAALGAFGPGSLA